MSYKKYYRIYNDVMYSNRYTIFPFGIGAKMFDITANFRDNEKLNLWREFTSGIWWNGRWGYIPAEGKHEVLEKIFLKYGKSIVYGD